MPFKSLSEKCHFKVDADEKNTCLKLTVTLLICLFFCGCQTGPTDEELINTTMNSWKQAIIAQDIDAIMEYYSENFSAQEAEDKEGMRELMEEAIEKGLLENIDINLETAQLTITDGIAEFSHVEIIGDKGEKELEFILIKEEKKNWRIIESVGIESASSPAIADDGTIYIGSGDWWGDQWLEAQRMEIDMSKLLKRRFSDKRLYAINPNGTLKWMFELESTDTFRTSIFACPAIGPDETIYFGGFNGIFYAIKDEGGKPKELWRYHTSLSMAIRLLTSCSFVLEKVSDFHQSTRMYIRFSFW